MNKTCSKFLCKSCDYVTSKKSSYLSHMSTLSHTKKAKVDSSVNFCPPVLGHDFLDDNQWQIMNDDEDSTDDDSVAESLSTFGGKPGDGKSAYVCNDCDFETSQKNKYKIHLNTKKHQRNIELPECSKESYTCMTCSKSYTSRGGLWKHKKSCLGTTTMIDKPVNSLEPEPDITLQNKELRFLVMEQTKIVSTLVEKLGSICPIPTTNTTNNTNNTTNNHNNIHNTQNNNQTFNLNFFLNETCKNAMNLTDFIDQLEITMEDLENMRLLGYSDGVSNILVKNLDKIAVSDRPIHSNDVKREKFYIRNNNQWVKETENYQYLINAIKAVVKKNTKQLMRWRELNPDFKDSSTKTCDIHHQIVINMFNGSDEEAQKNYSKIIKNIAVNVSIPKQNNYLL